jgi:hypothetical protein
MKKAIFIIAAAAVLAILASVAFLSRQTYVVELTQEQLQEQLDRGFPLEKGLLILKVRLSNPKVALKNGSDRIHFSVDAGTDIQIEGLTPRGTGTIATRIRYSPEEGAFYMSDPDLSLRVDGMKAEKTDTISEVANILIKEYAAAYPVYRLKDDDVKQNVARMVLKDVKVESGVLRLCLGLQSGD